MFCCCHCQENIELAKKDWELSHLLSLREEQDDITEEGVVEEVPLTYDRPTNNNKVTLHHSVTGLWQVCSSGQKDGPKTIVRDHPVRRKRQKHNNSVHVVHPENVEIPFPPLQREASSCDALPSGLPSPPSEGKGTKSSVSPQNNRRSPRVQSSMKCVILRQPVSHRTANSSGEISTDSPTKNTEHSDGNSCIGSRTRRRNVSGIGSSASLLGSTCSSTCKKPSAGIGTSDCDSTANHKYQTRLKASTDS